MKKYILLTLLAGIAAINCSCGDTKTSAKPTRIKAPQIEINYTALRAPKIEIPEVEISIPTIEIEIPVVEVEVPEINLPKYWDNIPLDVVTQLHILNLCNEKQIDPYIIFAIIHHESRFDAEIIGDGGDAFGLMQIQPKWHKERMANLGITDLLDPVQNVSVGIDYFAELLDMDKGLEWALMCYNGGPSKANKKANLNYATKVINTAAELAEK